MNNEAWGFGYNDWTLVARSNMRRNCQRRAPAKGFYDGADLSVHQAQMREVKAYNLGGVGLYHYWFFNRHELSHFENSLRLGKISLPWFLIWANESWSRRWFGDPTLILELSANPTRGEVEEHCNYLSTCFEDSDYLRIDGKPLFVFYNLSHFKDPERVVSWYREFFLKHGHEVALGQFVKNSGDKSLSKLVEWNYFFEPRLFFNFKRSFRGSRSSLMARGLKTVLGSRTIEKLHGILDRFQQRGDSFDAHSFLEYFSSEKRREFVDSFGGGIREVLSPSWNNFPRYGDRFTELQPISPQDFSKMVTDSSPSSGAPLLINSWNEWSEGAAIEPCHYMGSIYLDELVKFDEGLKAP